MKPDDRSYGTETFSGGVGLALFALAFLGATLLGAAFLVAALLAMDAVPSPLATLTRTGTAGNDRAARHIRRATFRTLCGHDLS